jgi:hypothetical protein
MNALNASVIGRRLSVASSCNLDESEIESEELPDLDALKFTMFHENKQQLEKESHDIREAFNREHSSKPIYLNSKMPEPRRLTKVCRVTKKSSSKNESSTYTPSKK